MKKTFAKLSFIRMLRTIKRSPLQFLAMILIITLATTLFSGLYASHLVFENQVNTSFKLGNAADIWTTAIYSSEEEHSEAIEEDYKLIQSVIGDNGYIEKDFNGSAKIRGLEAYISLRDTYPTINCPYNVSGQQDETNFFLFNEHYLKNTDAYGKREEWFNDDGSFKEINIAIQISGLKSYISKNNDKILNVLKEFTTTRDVIFNKEYLDISITPTGMMKNVENILLPGTTPSTFIISRNYLFTNLVKKINASFDIASLKAELNDPSTPIERKAILSECDKLLSNSRESIMDMYWNNNRFLTRLNNRNEATKYCELIQDAFMKKSTNNLLLNFELENTNVYKQVMTDVIQSEQMCYVFPPIFFLVAVLVVLTTLSQTILKERGEIGTLKALGSSTKSIIYYYLSLTGFITLMGTMLGIIIGPLLLPKVLDIKYQILYTLPGGSYVFPTLIVILMSVVTLAGMLLVTYFISRKEARALPAMSMRPKIVTIKNKGKLESKGTTNTHKLCYKMAKRNIFCSISRSVMVIIGVLGCTGLLCCGFGIDDSINVGINHDVNAFFNTDALLYLSNPNQKTIDELNALKKDNTLTACEAYGYLPTTCIRVGDSDNAFSTTIYSLDIYSEREYNFFDLGYAVKQDKVVVTSKVAKNLNLKVNDYIHFTFAGKGYTGQVGAIIDTFYIHGIFIDGTWSNFPMVSNYPTCAYVRLNHDLNYDDVINRIKNIEGISNIVNKDNLKSNINNVSSGISYITITIKVFAILLAIVVLYNLALLNYNENIRNIATMKVLGFNRREIAESLFIEIVLLSLVGILIGLSLGYPLTLLVLGVNHVPMCEFFYYLGPGSVFLSLFITLGTAILVNVYIGLKNKKVKMVESLKSIE